MTIMKTSTCDVDQLRGVIKSQIPKAHMESDEAEEVKFVLPGNQASKFEELFKTLETDGKTLGIDSFGVSVTTLEDVFLKSVFAYNMIGLYIYFYIELFSPYSAFS